MALIDKPERARQLARAIASDLSLYHEKKLIEGIEKDTLFDVMRDEIDEGRALYKSRVTPEIFNMGDLRSRAGRHADQVARARQIEDLVRPSRGPRRFVVAADAAGQRLDLFLARHNVAEVSRSQLARQIGEAAVTVNGAAGTPSRKLRTGRRGRLDAAAAGADDVAAEAIPLTIVHEDRWLVVIDKPAGLVVHPAPGHEAGTLVNALLAHCQDLRGIGGELRPGIVHRIDKDTSGLLVVAKDDTTMAALGGGVQGAHGRAGLRRAGGG